MAVDVVFFVFGLVGLHMSHQGWISRAVIHELGGDTLQWLARAIKVFSEADGSMNKAKVLVQTQIRIESQRLSSKHSRVK